MESGGPLRAILGVGGSRSIPSWTKANLPAKVQVGLQSRRRDEFRTGSAGKVDVAPTLYVVDKPNPYLSQFVQRHRRANPYLPQLDDYNIGPFQTSIETTKRSAIYALHGYHLGKKPHDAIRQYIKHFTKRGDLVLDPFSGSGSTALAALMEHRKAVAIDASPAATFIARYYLAPIDPDDFRSRFDAMMKRVHEELAWLYHTTCHRCGEQAILHYIIYSNTYMCPDCASIVSLFEASGQRGCRCPRCAESGGAGVISTRLGAVGFEPVATNFSCLGKCKPRRTSRSFCGPTAEAEAFRRYDLSAIEQIDHQSIPYPIPNARMMHVQGEGPWGDEWRPSRNFRCVSDLFTRRNLWALAALMSAAGNDLDLQALITSTMFAVSRKAQHLERGGGYIPGNWALPPMTKQRNVLESLSRVFRRSLQARRILHESDLGREVCLSTQTATDMHAIADESVDYIFTDPPYGGAVQYAELNFLWEAWLGFDAKWHADEVIVNRSRGLSVESWTERMSLALSECARVLKPGRWLSICYHDASEGTWEALLQAVSNAGLVNDSALGPVAIDTGGRTYNQYTVDKATKRDLVLSFRTRRSGEKVRSTSVPSVPFEVQADEIIREFLQANPGAEKSRIYDALVARLVQAGAMRSHDFDRLLRSIAQPDWGQGRVVSTGTRKGVGTSRWYLRNP